MPRKSSPTLTEAELQLMEIIWNRGQSTVADVVAALPSNSQLAYSTVLTTLRILERKGYVSHVQEGRAFIYKPVVDQKQARQSALKFLLSKFFNNSPELLVLNVMEQEELDLTELERLKKLVEEKE
ncbi:MAG TPA: BlaI/MecI/CopY family transcriptional regulator [Acidobacteriota bacterium]|nr:BlaI/MecI/CopY family transcriptional regulator [Acidobacteriota bacterium]HMZ81407.1 BlaI/MecI/CopY family transcriptional regulator [Acidobacteriota bacterium]HNB71461.1 BlaI/MecI/CopY family transcriptional regulator [Acidobacteriota bacterium]HND19767.1 BlaI/MecI/CopY family transcriptional regulator [Acidobacteriota bacterium]HNG93731.1 BlaI/MecI/CopY family transcriptional regulator [Acidobacteriota bacterium]